MKKTTKTWMQVVLMSLFLIALAGCDKEIILPSSDIPAEISSYISTHFGESKVLQAVEDKDGFTKTYVITLDNGVKLEFNRKKEIIEIDGTSRLPDSVIPEKILLYVSANYPTNAITDWELEDRHQQVGLDNDLDLEFTLDGDFIRIDN